MEVIEQALSLLLTLTVLLLVGTAAIRLAEHIGLPDVVLLLLIGVLVGPLLNLINIPEDSLLNQVILLGGAAYILFHGGTTVDVKIISKVWKTLLLLATVGVLVTAAIVGFAASYILGISLLLAFLLAAVLAPTDPATLIPVFNQVKIRPKVAQTVVSESTFNDATGASLVFVLIPIVIGTGTLSVAGSLGSFLVEAGVGVAVGLAAGLLFVIAVAERYRVMSSYASKLSVVAALLAFLVADKLEGSGFMAAFIAGLLVGNSVLIKHPISSHVTTSLHHFMDSNTAIMRIFIFVLLGSHVNFDLLLQNLWAGLAIVGVLMFVARPVTVLVCTLFENAANRWEWRERFFLMWTRETGVIPAALAGVLVAMKVPHADIIASVTFLAVLVTILLQASTTRFVARKLGMLESA